LDGVADTAPQHPFGRNNLGNLQLIEGILRIAIAR
jgi:hypothetical protein